MSNYFVYCPDCGMEEYDTIEKRDDAAHDCIQHHLNDGWDEAVDQVVAGAITSRATQTDLKKRPPDSEIDENGEDEDGSDWSGDFEFICDYKMIEVTA